MDGILLIDKPKGWTSFDVVARVRSILRSAASQKLKVESDKQGLATFNLQLSTPSAKPKVGHTGTLDPLATGLMIVVSGKYTKRAEEFSKLDKTYEVIMRLGQTSTTADEEGEKTAVSDKIPTQEELQAVLHAFTGEIMQTPPVFSAMKVNGQRAYKLARAGKEVTLEPRAVAIHSIALQEYVYPDVRFTAHVGSGTYIRSLVVDIGNELRTGAYMTDLRRTTVGDWSIGSAIKLDNVTFDTLADALIELQ